MAISTGNPIHLNLYCSEAASDLVFSNGDICKNTTFSSSDCLVDDDDESCIANLFDSELDQMLEPAGLAQGSRNLPLVVNYNRKEAVNWIMKVHAFYGFRPETAYLSINYMDRFLSCRSLPQGKGWPLQLLAVACLSLAAKKEEMSVPLLLDLQIKEPKFLFRPRTVQRMELLVMASLKWRLHIVTPFDFVHYFIAKVSRLNSHRNNFSCNLSRAAELIISTCRVISCLEYRPSTVAAAAVLWVTNQPVDDHGLGCLHKRINKEMLKRCHTIIKQNLSQFPHAKRQMLEPLPPSSISACDATFFGSCNAEESSKNDLILGLQTSAKD